MDGPSKNHNTNPYVAANPLSKLLFWWMIPLFKIGYVRPLEVGDMYPVCPEDQSELLGNGLEKEWKRQLINAKKGCGKPSLTKCLIRMFGLEYMMLGMILLLKEGIKLLQPLLLGGLIRYFSPGSAVTTTYAYLYAAGVSLCAVIIVLTNNPYNFGAQRLGMKMRIASCSLLYRKSLRLSSVGLSKTTTGQIVNLMSNDVNIFDQAMIFLHYLWVGPLEAMAILAILWMQLGPSAITGFAVLLLQVPLEIWMGNLLSKFRQRTAKQTDERVRLMNEIIAGMRVIKMYCWEKPFGDLVEKVRSTELRIIFGKLKVASVSETLAMIGKFPFVFATVLTVTLLGVGVRPEMIFLVIPYGYRATQVFTTGCHLAVKFGSELNVTIHRLETFMQLDELDNGETTGEQKHDLTGAYDVEIRNITAKWDKTLRHPTLKSVSASVRAGKLLAVIGSVGAGKSSLLMSILKELPLLKGYVRIKGKIAYVPQQPWVFAANLRQDIIFGKQFEKEKYDRILKACDLNKDIAVMPHGDLTLIGERGARLSGGQRARVCLARALYMEADIYLLDDPLSAVDSTTGRHLFERVIQGELKDKARILVTHQLQYLQKADHIVVLKEGEMIGAGTYKELSVSGIDFTSLLKPAKDDEDKTDEQRKSLRRGLSYDHIKRALVREKSRLSLQRSRNSSRTSIYSMVEKASAISLNSIDAESEVDAIELPEEEVEERGEGTVGAAVYYGYFKAGAKIGKGILLAALCLSTQVIYNMGDWWLAYWSNQEEERVSAIHAASQYPTYGHNTTNATIPVVNSHFNIGVFSAFIGSAFILGFLRAILFFKVTVDASQTLHNTMFTSILRSHIGFFDLNPVGRILNRFSKDMGNMDDLLPITFFEFIQNALLAFGIITLAGVINPWVFIPVLPLIVLFVIIARYYLRTSRHIKRLEGTTRSPVFSHLSASLQGLQTIRAFGVQDTFIAEFDGHQNLHTEAWFLFLCSSRWLAITLDWLCVIFVTSVSFFCVVAAESLNAGLVGLSMTYAISLMGIFQWGVRQSAEVENQMVSVERILDYSRLPVEAPLEVAGKRPPSHWPQQGVISADRASLQYFPDSLHVLKDISFYIKAKEKIGIVGRTVAGKSSLITMLFRLVEPGGTLMVDGVNIKEIGLHDLRKAIAIIPQDPTLFMGPLKRNLDPFGEHEDNVLWKSLSEVALKQTIADIPSGLDTEVSEGGVNFSVGQRQLICLARASLRGNKLIVIDEATANVDPGTDALIQRTIREKFHDCTVLTIAHRLNTVMDSDRIMVLDDGEIAEFDTPHTLLQRVDGNLHRMAQQTGHAEMEHLKSIARKAFNKHT